MIRDDKSLSYRAGYIAGKCVRIYFSRRPAWLYNFANKYGIGERWVKVCKFCFAVLFLFFVTDMHRYGAWYTGGATFIKPWWQFAYILLWVPVVTAVLLGIFTWLCSSEVEFIILIAILAMNYIILFIIILAVYMAEDEFMLTHGYLYLRQGKIYEVLEITFIISTVIGATYIWGFIRDIYGRSAELVVEIWHEGGDK